ncbi:MAG TPA: DUF2461 domain-containing protein [Sphingobacteriaceae bacterium]
MIRPSTFTFLEMVAANNNREWFNENRRLHDDARQNVLDFSQAVIDDLKKVDPLIPKDLEAKNCVMRIYRDIRFSKNKTPYKTNFGVGISPAGRKFDGPGYYIHLEPGGSFIGGGCWMPEAEVLRAIRQEIDYNASDFHAIIDNALFTEYFPALDAEDKLKTAPKGYPADHPDIEYLKLKSFTVMHKLDEAAMSGLGGVADIAEGFARLYPFIQFLRNALA